MKYVDLETDYKRKLSGSITYYLKGEVTLSSNAEDLFNGWVYSATKDIEGKIYYINRGIVTLDYEIDKELLDDIKNIFEERVKKAQDKIIAKEKAKEEKNKKAKEENNPPKMATEKQIKYANFLYEKKFGIREKYSFTQKTSSEMREIISELLEGITKVREEESKVINISDYR